MKRIFVIAGVAALAASMLAYADTNAQETRVAPVAQWRVEPPFAKSDNARLNISGLACAPSTQSVKLQSSRRCIAVNDETKYAQFFTIEGTTIVPETVTPLVGDRERNDPDAEGAAYDGGYFYVTGSHGLSRKDAFKELAFNVFRIATDGNVQRTPNLRDAIRSAPVIGTYAEQPLRDNGVNIEGIAASNGRLYFGLRAPSIDGKGFILSTNADDLFKGPTEVKVHDVALGTETGIRDIAAVEKGFLLLTGGAQDQAIPSAVHFWDGASSQPPRLAELDLKGLPRDAKAESLLVLAETPTSYKVLIAFDGIANGGPLEFELKK